MWWMPGHEDDRSVLIRSQEPVLLLSFLINHGTGTAPPLPAPLFSNTARAGLGWAGLVCGRENNNYSPGQARPAHQLSGAPNCSQ